MHDKCAIHCTTFGKKVLNQNPKPNCKSEQKVSKLEKSKRKLAPCKCNQYYQNQRYQMMVRAELKTISTVDIHASARLP